jgi:hypothetical protein
MLEMYSTAIQFGSVSNNDLKAIQSISPDDKALVTAPPACGNLSTCIESASSTLARTGVLLEGGRAFL